MPELQMIHDQIADIAEGEILHALMCHRNRHHKVDSCGRRQGFDGNLMRKRFVEPREAVENFIFFRPGIQRDRVVVPEGLRARRKLPGGPAKRRRDMCRTGQAAATARRSSWQFPRIFSGAGGGVRAPSPRLSRPTSLPDRGVPPRRAGRRCPTPPPLLPAVGAGRQGRWRESR